LKLSAKNALEAINIKNDVSWWCLLR
jgi:hypothetical protein